MKETKVGEMNARWLFSANPKLREAREDEFGQGV
jgi:hypothetical protein